MGKARKQNLSRSKKSDLLLSGALSFCLLAFALVLFPKLQPTDFSPLPPPSIFIRAENSAFEKVSGELFSDYAPMYLPTAQNFRRKSLNFSESDFFPILTKPAPVYGKPLKDKNFALRATSKKNVAYALSRAALEPQFTEAGREKAFLSEPQNRTPVKTLMRWTLVNIANGSVAASGKFSAPSAFNAVFRAEKDAIYGVSEPIEESFSGDGEQTSARSQIQKIMEAAGYGIFKIVFAP